MATLFEIMEAMADQIRDALDDTTDIAVQVEPLWVSNPTPPTIDIYPADPSNAPEFRASGDIFGGENLIVRARVDLNDSTAGQELLLALMDDEDPLSIAAALSFDDTFGGWAQTSDVRSRSGYVEQGEFMACFWEVVVVKGRS